MYPTLSIEFSNYSPAAIIKNSKIWNIFFTCIFPKMKLKSEFRISCSVRRKLFEDPNTIALTPNHLGISIFLDFLKSGGNLNDEQPCDDIYSCT